MIIGELLTGVRILLEKAPSGYNISEDQQLTEITPKVLFLQKKEPAKRRGRGGPPWAPPRPARALPWPHRLVGRGPIAPFGRLSFAYFFYQNLRC
jgi:hypothetical protein